MAHKVQNFDNVDSRISREWYERPNDERFLDLGELLTHVDKRRKRSRTGVYSLNNLRVEGDSQQLQLILPKTSKKDGTLIHNDIALIPTHHAFQQLCHKVHVPTEFMRTLPPEMVADIINYKIKVAPSDEGVKILGEMDPRELTNRLRAITTPSYGRIWDNQLVQAIKNMVDEDPRWKIPGVIDWSTGIHNPDVTVTPQTTTLFSSDRYTLVFLCQDANPIECGKTRNGEPDNYFPGFYAWNTEVYYYTIGGKRFFMRGVCENRNLWGVELDTTVQVTFRHYKNAPQRFEQEMVPFLQTLTDPDPSSFVKAVKAAKAKKVAKDNDERMAFLKAVGLNKDQIFATMNNHVIEEGRPAETVMDMINGITATARNITFQDERIKLEGVAEKLLSNV